MEQVGAIIAVASGKGGVGKSTTAVNLAFALQHLGLRVGLLDADIYGPSVAMMLGVSEGTKPKTHERQYFYPIEVGGIKTMSMGYLVTERTPMVWRGPMAGGALTQMLEQTLWGELDILLVDMPPGTGDIQLTLSQKAKLAGAVIVTTPQDIALLDAKKAIEMFNKVAVPVLGLVENMSVHICSACGHQEPIFGHLGGAKMAEDYKVPLLGSLPLTLAIRESGDQGLPVVMSHPSSKESVLYIEAAEAMLRALNKTETPSAPTVQFSDE